MFPSSAVFDEIDCPFLQWGRCKRPYCLYYHSKDNSPGVMTTTDLGDPEVISTNGASHTTEDNYACLEELERINKEIEAVRSEVEKEQKRLSQYQSSQSLAQTGSKNYLRTTSQTKDHNGNHLKYKKAVSSTSGQKYVVDHARPKTDLEYDPCSNFSADLLSSSSTECKVKSSDKVGIDHSLKSNQTRKNVQPLFHFEDSDNEGTLVIDIPSSTKDHRKRKTKPKGKSAVTKPQHIPQRNSYSDLSNDLTKPNQHKEKFSSEGLPNDEVNHTVGEQEKEKTLMKPVVITEEQESSEGELVIDVSQFEDEHKLPQQCDSITKELLNSPKLCPIISVPAEDYKEPNDGQTVKQTTITKHPVKEIKPFLVDLREEPVAEPNNSTNLNTETFVKKKEEKAQNMENVLDDFSTCLNNLRSESEKIKPIQVVNMLPFSSVNGDENISSQSLTSVPQNATFRRGPQVDCTSSYDQKSEIVSSRKISHAHPQYFPMVSAQSLPSSLHKADEHRFVSHSPMTEPSWVTVQKSPVEPFVQNMPAYNSGIDCGVVSTPSVSQLNLTTVESVQKLPTSSASFPTACDIPVSSQALATMAGSNDEPIVVDSSSDEELRYSDLDLSDTDPMEECYRIFMEANQSESHVVQCDAPEVLNSQEIDFKSNPSAILKKRVAHVAKFEPASKNKTQIIVPFQEGISQFTVPSRTQLCQRRATILTAAVKGCQSQIINSVPKKTYTANIIHASTVQNSCVGIIPVGATLQLGTNLHFVVPEGNCALPLTLIPTTMPVQRPPQPSPPIQLSQTLHPPHPPQLANYTPAKAMGVKRKAKVRHEVGAKVPHDVRQRYVNLFVEEFLKTSVTVQDAFEKALAEEKTVYDRSINKLKYLSIAVNALKRLKNLNVLPAKAPSERDQHVSRGNVPLNTQALQGPGDLALYEQLKEHILSEELLRVNNFPRKHQDKADFAIQYGDTKKGISDPLKRICCRCGGTFTVDRSGKHTRREECNYHYGKVIENRVPGGVESRYSCCENAVGSPGCQVFNLHVHDAVSLQGFLSSLPQSAVGKTCPGVYAVDTQICYTTRGLELARVTVVNSSLQAVFDSFVKPDSDVIDYNTSLLYLTGVCYVEPLIGRIKKQPYDNLLKEPRFGLGKLDTAGKHRFSGISEADVKSTSSSLHDVQAVLLSFINADTILIGHGLENDLAALKIIHSTVVDTSVVFPHRLGLPHKRELNSLTADYLRRIIQESVAGHDTREDATACMELMLWRVKEDSKVKRW